MSNTQDTTSELPTIDELLNQLISDTANQVMPDEADRICPDLVGHFTNLRSFRDEAKAQLERIMAQERLDALLSVETKVCSKRPHAECVDQEELHRQIANLQATAHPLPEASQRRS